MKEYRVLITKDAKADLRRHLGYIKRQFGNTQAIRNVRNDFAETAASLSVIAGSIREPDSPALKTRGLKRVNLSKHDYLLLFRVKDGRAEIIRMFHFLEDYENKLR